MLDTMSTIEVFADVACPFTHVGLRRLVAERDARRRPDVVLRVRSWPLELVNGKPLDPDVVAQEVAALRGSVAPDLFAGFDPSGWPVSSLPALSLAAAALTVSPATGEAVALALRTELFEHGRDISDPAVLASIAEAHAMTTADLDAGLQGETGRARVVADWHEGEERGVVGSPHFFVGDTNVFCPTLTISHHDGRFDIEVSTTQFEAFMERCFA
jgi:predicted DsbA family dithiol-disulfide isomerase